MRTSPILAVLAISVGLAACTRSNDALRVNTQAPPQPLPSSPSGTVQTAELQPTQPASQPAVPEPQPVIVEAPQAPTVPEPTVASETTQVASLEPDPAAKPITHETVTGAWTVNTDNPDCRVFLSFTQWSGGYRAGTRRCNATELTSVSAWDVKNNKVVLVDSNGSQVASLASAGGERYAGTTSGGNAITFSR